MKIALLGYGKMGRAIESIALQRRHSIALVVDENNAASLTAAALQGADAAIEFTQPSAAPQNLRLCFEAGIPAVCGTTGWLSQWQQVAQQCSSMGGGLFYASNFSIGVNMFFALNRYLAQIMKPHASQYSASMQEIHHIEKKDAPSGTAITLAEDIIAQNDALTGWNTASAAACDQLPIESIREGKAIGFHQIKYSGEWDEIVISHNATNRAAFAFGAVLAAEFMHGRRGIFGMQDLMQA